MSDKMRRLFVVRKDLNLSAGKLAAMVGHLAEAYWTNMLKNAEQADIGLVVGHKETKRIVSVPVDIWDNYVHGIFTKTICEAKSLTDLNKVKTYIDAINNDPACGIELNEGIDYGFIHDKCLTELKPENPDGTTTIGVWFRPLPDAIAQQISKKYKLYGVFDRPKLRCWKVTCKDIKNNLHEVGVMTATADEAMKSAEKSLSEGRHIEAKAITVSTAEGI